MEEEEERRKESTLGRMLGRKDAQEEGITWRALGQSRRRETIMSALEMEKQERHAIGVSRLRGPSQPGLDKTRPGNMASSQSSQGYQEPITAMYTWPQVRAAPGLGSALRMGSGADRPGTQSSQAAFPNPMGGQGMREPWGSSR